MAQHENVTAFNILAHARGIISPAHCWTQGRAGADRGR